MWKESSIATQKVWSSLVFSKASVLILWKQLTQLPNKLTFSPMQAKLPATQQRKKSICYQISFPLLLPGSFNIQEENPGSRNPSQWFTCIWSLWSSHPPWFNCHQKPCGYCEHPGPYLKCYKDWNITLSNPRCEHHIQNIPLEGFLKYEISHSTWRCKTDICKSWVLPVDIFFQNTRCAGDLDWHVLILTWRWTELWPTFLVKTWGSAFLMQEVNSLVLEWFA
jgi:hypothetical protein